MTDTKNEAGTLLPEVFVYHQHPVRVEMVNDEAWFVAKDVCDILALADTNKALLKVDSDEKLTRKVFVSGQPRNMIVVSESGLYSLIMRSNKPEAKAFRKWVTSEVLPSIRKNGHYGIENASTMQHITAIESGISALIGAVTSLTETFATVTIGLNERIAKLEQQSLQPVNAKKPVPNYGHYLDARNQEYDVIKINHSGVRRITVNETVYFSINDFCQAIGANTGATQIARKLNRQRPTAVKIWLFGNTHPAWFTTKNGLRLMVSGSKLLKNDNNVKLELRRV